MAEEPTNALGEALRKYREMRGYTQAELGARARINPTHISRLENGRTSNPERSTLVALAKALDIDPEVLFAASSRVRWRTSESGVSDLGIAPRRVAPLPSDAASRRLRHLESVITYCLAEKPERWSSATLEAARGLARLVDADRTNADWEDALDRIEETMGRIRARWTKSK
jgi:transcriptional regulator with XRE-family HTH domain